MSGNSWSRPFILEPGFINQRQARRLSYDLDTVMAWRKPNHEMRISFGNTSETDIREGIRRLGAVLRKFLSC